MPELLSPFVPAPRWLPAHPGVRFSETPAGLNLRDGPTRYLVIRAAISAIGPGLPTFRWALGEPWSRLTDEEAGRVAAEVVRRIGPDPSAPVGHLPVCLLGVWTDTTGRPWSRLELYETRSGARRCIDHGAGGWEVRLGNYRRGAKTGEAGRAAADAYAISQGAILIEQIRPLERVHVTP